jgi:hypothetical protein
MAKRTLTAAEERKLVKNAEKLRDDDEAELLVQDVKARSDATAVLSVRLPLNEIRFLREVASRRGVSLAALIKDVSSALAAEAEQRMSVSRGVARLHVTGVGLESSVSPAGASGGRIDVSGPPQLLTV